MFKRVTMAWVLAAAVLAVVVVAGCGALPWPGDWDETCYDCRTVCQGTEGDVLDDCLAACSLCQGYSECFASLDGQFDGQELSMADWDQVDCDEVN